MSSFHYQGKQLFAEQTSLSDLARQYGTPLYVYSREALTRHFHAYLDACRKPCASGEARQALICYSVKSNSNLAVLQTLAQLGAGFDIVSGGELERVLAAGGDPHKVIFSGVGKTRAEITLALKHDILCFNVESIAELQRINEVAAESGKRAPVSLRVNPNVDANTHPYISTGLKENKFGVAFDDALGAYRLAASLPNLNVTGIDCHIGSQLLDDAPLLEAFDKLIELVDALNRDGIAIHHMDIGGGVGVQYDDEQPVAVGDYLGRLFARLDQWRQDHYAGRQIQFLMEPGRSIVANAGVLVTEVQYLKPGETKNFVIVDAAMNDLMRPALYEAWHGVDPVLLRDERESASRKYDIVGPVCESGDWLARDRTLNVQPGDLIAFRSAGAYGMTMASNYNTRPRAAEVMIDGDQVHLIRQRETVQQLFALESLIGDSEK